MRPCKNPFLLLKRYLFLLVKYAVVSPFKCFCLPYFSYKIPNFSPKFALKILILVPKISPNFMPKSAGQPEFRTVKSTFFFLFVRSLNGQFHLSTEDYKYFAMIPNLVQNKNTSASLGC